MSTIDEFIAASAQSETENSVPKYDPNDFGSDTDSEHDFTPTVDTAEKPRKKVRFDIPSKEIQEPIAPQQIIVYKNSFEIMCESIVNIVKDILSGNLSFDLFTKDNRLCGILYFVLTCLILFLILQGNDYRFNSGKITV